MADFELKAELRSDKGKGASRRLRRKSDYVPAILYGAGKDPQAVYSQIITINSGNSSEDAILKDLQRHPAKDRIMHADFLRIRMDQEITVEVPLHFINEENCVGVRQGGGNISHNMTSLEITCLPGDLPEYIEVDVADVDVGGSIHMSELTLPNGLVVPSLKLGPDHDHVVVSVNAPKRIEEEDKAEDSSVDEDDAPSGDEDGGEG
jgi:large subunit ribosomal protein L25